MRSKRTTERGGVGRGEWDARPGLARAIRVGAVLVPLGCGMVASVVVSGLLPGGGSVVTTLLRTLVVIGVSSAVVWAVDRLARRLLPLAALLQLSLVFPDQAPSRFRAALRSGSSRRLERLVQETRSGGLPGDPGEAAHRVVELIGAIGDHDRRTRGHSERVRLYADLIGEELRLGKEDRQRLQWGALLHDLGKLLVPTEILNKAGRPTEEEWAVLAQHPAHGERLIAPLRPFLGEWAAAVGGHHERWDGRGYPRGIAGADIPRAAAIVAVADSYEVMTAIRSYKSAMSLKDARAELTRCAGSQFDPEIVRAFLSISLGQLRVAMGPLAALAHLPFLEGVARLGGSLGSAGGAVAQVVTGAAPAMAGGVAATALVLGGVGPGGAGTTLTPTAAAASAPAGPSTAAPASGSDSHGMAGAVDEDPSPPPDEGTAAAQGTESPAEITAVESAAAGSPTTTAATVTTTTAVSTQPSTSVPTTPTTAAPASGAPSATTPPTTVATTTTTEASGSVTIMVSTNKWRLGGSALSGQTLPAGSTVYVFLATLSGSAEWWLAANDAGQAFSEDEVAPLDLAGTNTDLSAKPYVLPSTPGTYSITVKRSGSGSGRATATFTVT